MITVGELCDFLDELAPPELAAPWDNVGLLVGDRTRPIERVMTCLTVTPAASAEAIRQRAGLIVTHHPLPFQPLKRLTAEEPTGKLLLDLIQAGTAIYSPHTAYDSATAGINQQLAEGLGLIDVQPLEPAAAALDKSSGAGARGVALGAGRYGRFPQPRQLAEIAVKLKEFLKIATLQMVGDPQTPVGYAAVACGSAGEFLGAAARCGCQLLVTGETRLHTCYEAAARGIALLLVGHYASERFGIERLAEILARQFPCLVVWASRDELDPLKWF